MTEPVLLTVDVSGFLFPSQIVICTRVNTNLQLMDPATLQSKFELLYTLFVDLHVHQLVCIYIFILENSPKKACALIG